MHLDAIEVHCETDKVFRALRRYGSRYVPGDGPSFDVPVAFVGEAPGAQEDRQRKPFVGPSGKLLDEGLATIGLRRSDVYVTNIIKYRPMNPPNRDPTEKELLRAKQYLREELMEIDTDVLVCVGRLSSAMCIDNFKSMGSDHGCLFLQNGWVKIPIYHPAAALRQKRIKSEFMEDFQVIKEALG